jgi:hypothetical protein
MSKKQNPNPKLFPYKECEESTFDCNECKYEGCNAHGCGFLDEEEEM